MYYKERLSKKATHIFVYISDGCRYNGKSNSRTKFRKFNREKMNKYDTNQTDFITKSKSNQYINHMSYDFRILWYYNYNYSKKKHSGRSAIQKTRSMTFCIEIEKNIVVFAHERINTAIIQSYGVCVRHKFIPMLTNKTD